MTLLGQQLADEEERCRKLRETVTKLTGHGNNKQKISLHLNLKKEINDLQLQNKQLQRDLQKARRNKGGAGAATADDDAVNTSCASLAESLVSEVDKENGGEARNVFEEIESF